jgi:D-alanyl-D-alanine carboxypeptidase
MGLHLLLGRFNRTGLITVVALLLGLSQAVAAPSTTTNQQVQPKGKVAAAAIAPAKKLAPRSQKLHTALKKPPASSITSKRADRYAAFIVDAGNGQVVLDENGDAPRHPASLTKVMTLYLTFEALDHGRLTMDQRLPVSGWASVQSPTKLDLKEGTTITVHDAILGLITKSANDAAVVLAEALGGDEEIFAQKMTEKARQLGMKNTLYRNASGLPNDEQITTARDLAILTLALIRNFPAYYPLFSTQEFVYGGRINTNHNRMLGWYNGAEGLKTGYVNASGYNIILTAKREDRRLIGIMMGGDSAQSRDNALASLMDGAFNGPSSLVAGTDKVAPAPKTGGSAVVPVSVAAAPAWTPTGKDPIGARIAAVNPAAPNNGNSLSLGNRTNVALTPPPTLRNGGETWAMQVGAFSDTGAARNAIATAQITLPDIRATPSIAPIDTKGRTLYRARLAGLSQSDAVIGCRRLQDQGALDCTAVKVDPSDLDVAAN